MCTKAGFLPFDARAQGWPGLPARTYLTVACGRRTRAWRLPPPAPAYLLDQFQRSLRNLRLAAVDVFYLHNPEPAARSRGTNSIGAARGLRPVRVPCRQGSDRRPGRATWNGFPRPAHGQGLPVPGAPGRPGQRGRRPRLPLPRGAAAPEPGHDRGHSRRNQPLAGEDLRWLPPGAWASPGLSGPCSRARSCSCPSTPPALSWPAQGQPTGLAVRPLRPRRDHCPVRHEEQGHVPENWPSCTSRPWPRTSSWPLPGIGRAAGRFCVVSSVPTSRGAATGHPGTGTRSSSSASTGPRCPALPRLPLAHPGVILAGAVEPVEARASSRASART